MNTKDKLDLLWKYLLLLVVTIGVIRFTNEQKSIGRYAGHTDDSSIFFLNDDEQSLDVNVETEIINGDTLMNITLNGEEIDLDSYTSHDGKLEWKSKDGEMMVINIDDDSQANEDHKKVIKKKIVIKDNK